MERFSERLGYAVPSTELDERDLPTTLKNGLWDVFRQVYVENIHQRDSSGYGGGSFSPSFKFICEQTWFSFFRESIDDISPSPDKALARLRERFFRLEFPVFYDLIEFFADISKTDGIRHDASSRYTKQCNYVPGREMACFRFAGKQLVRISEPEELLEVEAAIQENPCQAVRKHVSAAARLYGDRSSPDYRNSIKESVSAVEAAVTYALGRKSSGVSDPLQALVKELGLHPALAQGFTKLYAYTSDSDGIRHALFGESNLSQDDARYMLVSCSAFANYLIRITARRA